MEKKEAVELEAGSQRLQVDVASVPAGFFPDTIPVMWLGRPFQAGDHAASAGPTVILAHGLWQRLGGDPGLIGSRIRVGGAGHTVVGILAAGLVPADSAEVFVPR